MKIIRTSFILVILIILAISSTIMSKKNNTKNKNHSKVRKSMSKSKETPRGIKLRNHFGTPSISNQYGPKGDAIAQYVEANPDTFAPMLGEKNRQKLIHANDFHTFPGYEKKMNPSAVKAGLYTNIAPSATHEVNPEITGPKLQVVGQYEYPQAVKVPTFYGFSKELHPVIAYDKLTGEIIEDSVLINRPVYNYENRVSNVGKSFEQFYDLRNGERISVKPNIKTHGIDTVKDDDWKPLEKSDKCKKNRRRLLR